MNSKSTLTKLVSNLKNKRKSKGDPSPKLSFSQAATEIAEALKIENDAATMTLYGLCASRSVRCINDQEEIIDYDECTIAAFSEASVTASVLADDVRYYLTGWSPDPLPDRRWDVIRKMLAEHNPPRTISWKEFCDRVRDECNGWIKTGGKLKPGPGFSQKQIQRIVKDLRAK